MKHTDLIRALRKLARQHGVELTEGKGGRHEKWYLGTIPIPVPRHKEISERTAQGILKDAAAQLDALTSDEEAGE